MGFLQTKKGKKVMGMLYGIGAAIVIVGALFKIQHWKGAGLMLTVGLLTEALIFFVSAFDKPHEEPDWTLVYPELAGLEPKEHSPRRGGSISNNLDKMLDEAKIGPELIESLSNGIKNLSENAAKLSVISDAAVATNDYIENVKNASKTIGSLAESYVKASASLTGLSVSNEAGQSYGEQLQQLAKNLSALNSVYELQLKGSTEQLKATNQFYEGITELLSNLNSSVEDTRRYKDEVSKLTQNLTALNTIYGNMLSAMNFNR